MSRATEESNRRMLRARDTMDRDYAQPLDVPTLARISYVSEAHFIRTLHATFGETPHRYLQRRRVERAMFLLRESDRSVSEICLDGLRQPRDLRPHLSRDRRGVADRVQATRRRPAGGAGLLREGLDETEQFWRSARCRGGLTSPA